MKHNNVHQTENQRKTQVWMTLSFATAAAAEAPNQTPSNYYLLPYTSAPYAKNDPFPPLLPEANASELQTRIPALRLIAGPPQKCSRTAKTLQRSPENAAHHALRFALAVSLFAITHTAHLHALHHLDPDAGTSYTSSLSRSETGVLRSSPHPPPPPPHSAPPHC